MVDLKEYRFDSKGTIRTTPIQLFKQLDKEFHFTLDLAASDENHLCNKYFTEYDDGLSQDWSDDICWLNPPFGRAIKTWMKKAYSTMLDGGTVVCLVPVRSNTSWWHDYCMKGEIRFIKGRPKFSGHKHGLPWPIAIVIFDNNADLGKMKSLLLEIV